MQQRFLLQILLLAQHVSGTHMPIIRSSRVLYTGCCLWYFVLWFSSCWSGVEVRIMCPVCRMLQHPANRTDNPQLKATMNFVMFVCPHGTTWLPLDGVSWYFIFEYLSKYVDNRDNEIMWKNAAEPGRPQTTIQHDTCALHAA